MRAQQVKQVLQEVLDPVGHVDALVILFAMITDIEKVNFGDLLGHISYRRHGLDIARAAPKRLAVNDGEVPTVYTTI
jgi:hypothetical protein